MTERSVILFGEFMQATGGDVRKHRKRIMIMNAALKVFSSKGYSPTVIEEIADEAGIAKGTLYLYFKDKEDLYYSTVMYVVENLEQTIKREMDEEMPPLVALEKLSILTIRFFAQNRAFINMYILILHNNLVRNFKRLFESLLKKEKELYDFESRIIEHGKAEGVLNKKLATEDVVDSFHGIISQTISRMFFLEKGRVIDPDGKAKSVMNIFLNGVGAR